MPHRDTVDCVTSTVSGASVAAVAVTPAHSDSNVATSFTYCSGWILLRTQSMYSVLKSARTLLPFSMQLHRQGAAHRAKPFISYCELLIGGGGRTPSASGDMLQHLQSN